MQPLRLLQHLPVAATKLPQHPVGYMRDALSWVTEGPPQGLQHRKRRSEIRNSVLTANKRSRELKELMNVICYHIYNTLNINRKQGKLRLLSLKVDSIAVII